MIVDKTDNSFRFDFTHGGRRVRKTIPCEELVYFLEGGDFHDPDSNLPSGKAPIAFYEFAFDHYLPLHSRLTKKPAIHKVDQVSAKALARYFGDMPVHAITLADWEEYKRYRTSGPVPVKCARLQDELQRRTDRRLPLSRAASAWTVNRELSCLNQVLEYAVRLKHIKANLVASAVRLPTESRKAYWLKKPEILAYLAAIPDREGDPENPAILRDFAEFLVLTGARIGEALLFQARDIDAQRGEIKLATFKKRRSRERRYRYLSIASLGPRFQALLARLRPDPRSGYFFTARRSGQPFKYPWLRQRLIEGARAADLPWLRVHDLRHTFAMHRAIVVRDFRQLQHELGHEDPMSIQSYLDNAARMRPEDSIFSENMHEFL